MLEVVEIHRTELVIPLDLESGSRLVVGPVAFFGKFQIGMVPKAFDQSADPVPPVTGLSVGQPIGDPIVSETGSSFSSLGGNGPGAADICLSGVTRTSFVGTIGTQRRHSALIDQALALASLALVLPSRRACPHRSGWRVWRRRGSPSVPVVET
jgi:hypothetical protein